MMNIIHFALSCFYIEGYKYQENVLPRIHAQMGHNVLMVASCFSFDAKGEKCILTPVHYHSEDGFDVIRLPYKKPFNKGILTKVHIYNGVMAILEEFKPDILFFHGVSSLELYTISRYMKKHPKVALFIDNHADRNNSAGSFFSLVFLHKLIYKPALSSALAYTEKVLCISIECIDFCKEVYGVPERLLEFYPLGGEIPSEKERFEARQKVREIEGLKQDDIVFIHTGKIGKLKRTVEIVDAFQSVANEKAYLLIVGVLMDDVRDEILLKIQGDKHVHYLGWKSPDELNEYLCASDVYVQPGSQSATMQNAMCCGCAVMLYPFKSHKPFVDGNGFYVQSVEDMKNTMRVLIEKPTMINSMGEKSIEIANNLLNYDTQAERVLVSKNKL